MKRIAILLMLNLFANIVIAQPNLNSISYQFADIFCDCLEQYANESPKAILYESTDTCVRSSMWKLRYEFDEVSRKMTKLENETDYQLGRRLGKNMIFVAVDSLVENCSFYRQTMDDYTTLLKNQLKPNAKTAVEMIQTVSKKAASTTDNVTLAKMEMIIAYLYEFLGEKQNAISYYQKSLNNNPTSTCKALKRMLELR
jgi:tetratricopeptide (TPR) repeat protein